MKKIVMGMSLLASLSTLAGQYATEFPSNSKRIAALVNLKGTTYSLMKNTKKLLDKSSRIKMLNNQSKINFCMTLAETNVLAARLGSEIDSVTPAPPYMLNFYQSKVLEFTSDYLNKVNSNTYSLNEYCKGAYKVKEEERDDKIREIIRKGQDAKFSLNQIIFDSALLSPMTVDEMREVSSQEEIIKEEARKECMLF
jgi:16S rRNA G966 N2-methylase RsmD